MTPISSPLKMGFDPGSGGSGLTAALRSFSMSRSKIAFTSWHRGAARLLGLDMWRFRKYWRPFLGVLVIRIIVYWGLIWGLLFMELPHTFYIYAYIYIYIYLYIYVHVSLNLCYAVWVSVAVRATLAAEVCANLYLIPLHKTKTKSKFTRRVGVLGVKRSGRYWAEAKRGKSIPISNRRLSKVRQNIMIGLTHLEGSNSADAPSRTLEIEHPRHNTCPLTPLQRACMRSVTTWAPQNDLEL